MQLPLSTTVDLNVPQCAQTKIGLATEPISIFPSGSIPTAWNAGASLYTTRFYFPAAEEYGSVLEQAGFRPKQ